MNGQSLLRSVPQKLNGTALAFSILLLPQLVRTPSVRGDEMFQADQALSLAPSAPTSQPATKAATPQGSLFTDAEDGQFDISGFLSSRVGFLPLAIPITEPAVGYGLTLGLTFFHDKPKVVPGAPGQPSRAIMPSTTMLFGAATENRTWAGGIAHLGIWDDGRIRYVGALGYASLKLDWFGKGDALNGHAISYTNDVLFFLQRITFQLGNSDFFIGPQYRFISTDATFDFANASTGVPSAQLQSQTSGLGINFSYNSLDHPYAPTRGIHAEISYSQQAEWLAGDFNYGRLQGYWITFFPLGKTVVLGVNVGGGSNIGDAPFYDLPMIQMRGIPIGRFVDNVALQAELELRWDIARRWSLVGFGGAGRVGSSVDDLLDGPTHTAVGAGFRYLVARDYGLRMGLDLAHSDESDWTIYVTVGTGWIRP